MAYVSSQPNKSLGNTSWDFFLLLHLEGSLDIIKTERSWKFETLSLFHFDMTATWIRVGGQPTGCVIKWKTTVMGPNCQNYMPKTMKIYIMLKLGWRDQSVYP